MKFAAPLIWTMISLALGVGASPSLADDGAAELLEAIERAEQGLNRLNVSIVYDKEFALAGDFQRRTGELFFVNEDAARSFAIRFDTLRLGDVIHDDVQLYVFDGEWLVEKQPGKKLFTKRQVVPPGEEFDPLKIGEGPLPIPIGQKRADIERTFEVSVPPVEESLDEDTDAMRIVRAPNAEITQLRLLPRANTRESRDFEEIRVWYRTRGELVLPTIARTVNHQGDVSLVLLIGHKVNSDAAIPEGVFSTEAPARGWDVQVLPYREGAHAVPTTELRSAYTFDPPRPGDTRLAKRDAPEDTPGGAPDLEPPMMAGSVERLLSAAYLTDAERAEIRRKHGFWTTDDIAEPDHLAETALTRHDWLDPVFDDPEVRDDLRAEALLHRGDPEGGLELLAGDSSPRAIRLRAEALAMLGRFDEADAAMEPLVERLQRVRLDDADDMCEAVRVLMLRARLRGQERKDGTDFDTLLALLKHAREQLDPMSWRVRLLEAELLFDKHNRSEANDAALEAHRLNPAAAGPLTIMGEIGVGSFSFPQVSSIARQLRALTAYDAPWWVERPEDRGEQISAPAAGLIARARLRQDDPEGALSVLNAALARLPDSRELLALQVGAISQGYDRDETARALAAYDARSPGAPEAWFMAGWALAERRQYEEAAGYLEEAMRRLPTWPQPAIELGLLEIQSGRDERARAALEAVAELDPFNTRAANSLTLLDKLASHETVESEHFIVRYRPGIDALLASEMLPRLEAMHEVVTSAEGRGLGHEPDRKTVIELMPDHAMFAVRITGMPALYTVAACTGPVIAMERPMLSPEHSIGPYDWERVLRHEYTHTVSLSLTRNRIPHWFTEAVAQHLEDAPKAERTCRLLASSLRSGGLFGFEEINARFVRPRPNSRDRELAYAQGLWMYEFMVERFGAKAPIELMQTYAGGVREADAMRSVLGTQPELFSEDFEEWAWEQVRSWGVAPPEGVPTMTELASDEGILLPPTEGDLDYLLDAFPDHPELLGARFDLFKQDETFTDGELSKRAVAAAEAYIEACPIAESPHRALVRHHLNADREKAVPHLRFLAEREQYNPGFAAELADLLAARGEFDEAERWAERATMIAPFSAEQREMAARISLLRRDYANAERHLTMLAAVEPDLELHQQRLEKIRALNGG